MTRYRMNIATAALTLATAAVFAGLAGAQQPPPDAVRNAFAEADANGDGRLNIDEYVANVIYVFKQVDKNRDGFITEQELAAYSTTQRPALFKSADRNGDGKLSVGEAVAFKVVDFFAIDQNHDGALSIEEVVAFERAMPAAAAKK